MTAFSIVISIRNRSLDRLELLTRSVRESNFEGALQIVVSDYGSDNHVEVKKKAQSLGIDYVYTRSDVWNKSKALNRGLELARHPRVITIDLDMILSPNTLVDVSNAMDRFPDSCVVLQSQDLPKEISVDELLSAERFDWEYLSALSTMRARWGIGGLFAFPQRALQATGGLDERMVGWGAEDLDFAKRCQQLGFRILWLDEPGSRLFHVWHPSTKIEAETHPEKKELVAKNREIYYRETRPIRNLRRVPSSPGGTPRVSVVIATRNRADLIQESINSILAQTFQDFEINVVDDGSEDGTAEVVQSIDDPRIQVFSIEPSGIAAARNFGTTKATGEFIAVHDDDDLMTPTRLETCLKEMREGVGAVYGSLINFQNETGEMAVNVMRANFGPATIPGMNTAPGHSTWLVRTELMRAVRYDEKQSSAVDNNLAIRLANAGVRWVHSGKVHLMRRQHSKQITVSDGGVQTVNAAAARAWYLAPLSPNLRTQLADKLGEAGWPEDLEGYDHIGQNLAWLPDHLVTRDVTIPDALGIEALDLEGDIAVLKAELSTQIDPQDRKQNKRQISLAVLRGATWRDLAILRRKSYEFELARASLKDDSQLGLTNADLNLLIVDRLKASASEWASADHLILINGKRREVATEASLSAHWETTFGGKGQAVEGTLVGFDNARDAEEFATKLNFKGAGVAISIGFGAKK